jgi:hypothetical protein
MMTLFNAEERSKQDFADIFESAGWKLDSVSTLTTILDRFIYEGVPDPSWEQ